MKTLASLIIISAIVLAGCSANKDTDNTIQETELTRKDIIYLYNIPLDKEPYKKYVWSFDKPMHVRVVVDRKLPNEPNWKLFKAVSFMQPTKNAIFVYNFISEAGSAQNNRWILKCYRGIVDIHVGNQTRPDEIGLTENTNATSFCSSVDFILPTPGNFDHWQSETPTPLTPENLITFGNKDIQYRLRLERSETKFPADVY